MAPVEFESEIQASKQAAADLHFRPNVHKRGREIQALGRIRTHNPNKRTVADLRLLEREAAGIGLLTD